MTTIIFDLDGTLIDTTTLVLPAFREVIRHFDGMPMPSEETMLKTFGMPDQAIWGVLMPTASLDQQNYAHALTDNLIHDRLAEVDVLLPHAVEMLTTLQERGHTLTVASNCGVPYLDAALDSQGIRPFFTHPLCLGSVNGQRKADILTAHFQRFAKSSAVMIGDRRSDIEAAEAHHIPSIGCAFGFGDAVELAGASTIIHSLKELLPMFDGNDLSLLFPHGRG